MTRSTRGAWAGWVLGIAAILGATGCGAPDPASEGGHVAVSTVPTATATATGAPGLSFTGVPARPLAEAAFGMHVNGRIPSAWPDVSVGAFRIWNADSTWGALEPSPGGWSFAALDARVAQAESRNASVLLVLSHPPGWAATSPNLRGYGGSPSMPRDLDQWRTYVRTVAGRYAGRIEAYEIWNEPNLAQFFTGTPEELAELTVIAAEEIRAADPSALVVSAGLSARTTGSVPYFQRYLAALPPAAIDVVGIHVYPYPGNGPESMLDLTTQFRDIADAAGQTGKPMWNTEIGYGRTPDAVISGDTAASLILRTFLVLPSRGIDRNYWYAWDDRGFVGLFLVEADRQSPSPAGRAFAEAQRWLAGSSVTECADRGDGLWECRLNRGGQSVLVAWKLGAPAAYQPPVSAVVGYPFTKGAVHLGSGQAVQLTDLPVLFAEEEIPELAS